MVGTEKWLVRDLQVSELIQMFPCTACIFFSLVCLGRNGMTISFRAMVIIVSFDYLLRDNCMDTKLLGSAVNLVLFNLF